jgi:hypothetical protein
MFLGNIEDDIEVELSPHEKWVGAQLKYRESHYTTLSSKKIFIGTLLFSLFLCFVYCWAGISEFDFFFFYNWCCFSFPFLLLAHASGTWNCNSTVPPKITDDLDCWLCPEAKDFEHDQVDIYVFGFQEIVKLNTVRMVLICFYSSYGFIILIYFLVCFFRLWACCVVLSISLSDLMG